MTKTHNVNGTVWSMAEESILQLINEGQKFAGMGGSALSYFAAQSRIVDSMTQGTVKVISIDRPMAHDDSYFGSMDMRAIAREFESARVDDSISAVVMDIDCPGSTCLGMAELCEAADKLRGSKPLIAHCSAVCASGGYQLASRASKIYATPRSQVGSIGVRVMFYDFSKQLEDAGIKPVVIDTGAFKSLGAVGVEVTDEHKAHLQQRVDECFADFKASVQQGRNFTTEQLESVSDGRVWLAEQAKKLGLIDGVQSLAETLTMASRVASPTTPRSKAMSATEQVTPEAPKAATLAQLKKAFPESSAEFREEQLENEATMEQAATAYANEQGKLAKEAQAKLEELEAKATADAEAKAKKEASSKTSRQPVGNQATTVEVEQESADSVSYREMAIAYQKEHGCRWSEACLAIKRKHPEARQAFGAHPE